MNSDARINGPAVHELKIDPVHFDAVREGDKRAEIRDTTDRDFMEGDYILLRGYDRDKKRYTGPTLMVIITHILKNMDYLQARMAMLSIKVVK